MSQNTFSLFHHAAPPKTSAAEGAPLLLMLHGFGANEDDLFSIAPYVDERFLVISARAPVMLAPMSYAWFNLGITAEGILVDPNEVEQSRQLLHRFIEELIKNYPIDPRKIFFFGFSQGAMMGLMVALTYPGIAAGVVSMSGRVVPQAIDLITDREALTGLPIFATHGTMDIVLPIRHGRETKAALSQLPVDLTYREYPMGHEVSLESLRDVTQWLKSQLDRISNVAVN